MTLVFEAFDWLIDETYVTIVIQEKICPEQFTICFVQKNSVSLVIDKSGFVGLKLKTAYPYDCPVPCRE